MIGESVEWRARCWGTRHCWAVARSDSGQRLVLTRRRATVASSTAAAAVAAGHAAAVMLRRP